jgi:hypothetical protein
MTATRSSPHTAFWTGTAFFAALLCAVSSIIVLGPNKHGISIGLLLTARLSFLLFWMAYTSRLFATLLGPAFGYLKMRGALFGLAFAAAHLVHLGLVIWLCIVGDVPPLSAFVLFGFAVFWVYLIAALSLGGLIGSLNPTVWWCIRTVGMNYILYAFAVDFLRYSPRGTILHEVAYMPFDILVFLAIALRIVDVTRPVWRSA